VTPWALSVHRGRCHRTIRPTAIEDRVGVGRAEHDDLLETLDVHAELDALVEREGSSGRLQEIKHLLVVDLQEGALAEECDLVSVLSIKYHEKYGNNFWLFILFFIDYIFFSFLWFDLQIA